MRSQWPLETLNYLVLGYTRSKTGSRDTTANENRQNNEFDLALVEHGSLEVAMDAD